MVYRPWAHRSFWRSWLIDHLLPSGKHTKSYGKSPFIIGKSTINGSFSIAMLNYQRVNGIPKNSSWKWFLEMVESHHEWWSTDLLIDGWCSFCHVWWQEGKGKSTGHHFIEAARYLRRPLSRLSPEEILDIIRMFVVPWPEAWSQLVVSLN